MRKTPGATKAHAAHGYCKHLRKGGKRLANKATRKDGFSRAYIEAMKQMDEPRTS